MAHLLSANSRGPRNRTRRSHAPRRDGGVRRDDISALHVRGAVRSPILDIGPGGAAEEEILRSRPPVRPAATRVGQFKKQFVRRYTRRNCRAALRETPATSHRPFFCAAGRGFDSQLLALPFPRVPFMRSRSRKILPSTAERDSPPSLLPIAPAVLPSAQSCFSSAIRSSFHGPFVSSSSPRSHQLMSHKLVT